MKITKLETFFVKPRWMFLKISTDVGLVGWGEPIVEGRARTVATAIMEHEKYLIGQDPRRIEHHWQVMYRGVFYRGGPVLTSALSGIEQALWDIKGKDCGLPVYEMLGGAVRDRIRMYAGCHGGGMDDHAGAAAAALERKGQGFTAIKTAVDGPVRNVDTPAMVAKVAGKLAAMREAVGDEMDIAVDCHGRVSPAMAVRFARAFEPYGLMFLEEPCLPQNVDAMARIARSTTIPIATGERLFTRWGFRRVLEEQAAAVLQPDLCHAGGIFEVRKIAAMAETYYLSVAPHNPLGPISLAACLQLDACTPNFLIQEHPADADGRDLGVDYFTQPFVIKDGYIAVPQGPGLGIEVNEDAVAAHAYVGDWENPLFEDPDDHSVADW